jgi:hypothetical protein
MLKMKQDGGNAPIVIEAVEGLHPGTEGADGFGLQGSGFAQELHHSFL